MSDELRDRARKLFKAPFKYVSGYIWDNDGEMLADNHVKYEAETQGATLRVRGWGRLGYIAKSPAEVEALQDAYGELIAEALTAHFGRSNATLVPSDKLAEMKAERAEARALLKTAATFLSCDPDSVDITVVREFGMTSEDTRSLLALIFEHLKGKS